MNVRQIITLCVGGLVAGALWLSPADSHARVTGHHSPTDFDFSFDFVFGPREFYILAVSVLTFVALLLLRDRRGR